VQQLKPQQQQQQQAGIIIIDGDDAVNISSAIYDCATFREITNVARQYSLWGIYCVTIARNSSLAFVSGRGQIRLVY